MVNARFLSAPVLIALLSAPIPSFAQVATNITPSGLNTQVAAPRTLSTGQVAHDITGGTRPGNGPNLFHSLGQLNLAEGHIANFLNDSGMATSTILGRITDGNPSNIFGTLQTTGFGNANLFLINPAGFLFGPNASVNIGGTLAVSTANYIKLADGARFKAVPSPSDALLSAAPVAAFGFLGSNPAAIAVQGSTLQVAEGNNVILVGGNRGFIDATATTVPGGVTITNASLIAPGGQINIVSVGKPSNPSVGGEVPLNSSQAPSGFASMGDMTIVRNVVDRAELTTQFGGGKIVIRGGQVQLENYRVTADGTGGEILIEGKTVSIRNNDLPCSCGNPHDGIRIGGNYGTSVTVTASDSVTVDRALIGGAIDPFAVFPTGAITIKAPSVNVNRTTFRVGSSLSLRGSLSLLGDNVAVVDSSIVKYENFLPVDVNIRAQRSVHLDGFNMQQLYGVGDQPGSAVSIQGRDVEMRNVQIGTDHWGMDGPGDAGPITIAGQRNVSIADSNFSANTGATPRVSDAGNISVTAGKDLSVDNTTMTANTTWAGQGGNIVLGAGGNLTLDQSALSVNSTQAQANVFGTGPAGNIAIGGGKNVSVTNSTLSANSNGPADAGVIGIGATKNLSIRDSSISAEALGGGADGLIVLGAGKNVSLDSTSVMPAPIVIEP